jgi:hypothetical protein
MKTSEQLELFEVAAADPNVIWLERYLLEASGWLTAGQLSAIAGKADSEDGRRWVRSLAQASEWVISGQKGYKHVKHATAEDLNHFMGWMESQGKKMIGRAERMRRNAHALVG